MTTREWFRVMRAWDWETNTRQLLNVQRIVSDLECVADREQRYFTWIVLPDQPFVTYGFESAADAEAFVHRHEVLARLARNMEGLWA